MAGAGPSGAGIGSPTTSGTARVASSNEIDVEKRIVTDGRYDIGALYRGKRRRKFKAKERA